LRELPYLKRERERERELPYLKRERERENESFLTCRACLEGNLYLPEYSFDDLML